MKGSPFAIVTGTVFSIGGLLGLLYASDTQQTAVSWFCLAVGFALLIYAGWKVGSYRR